MAEPSKAYSNDVKPKWSSATDTISADIRAAAVRMVADSRIPGSSLGRLLNVFLSEHIPWPYRAGPGNAFDSTGTESSKFESLIYTSPDAVERVPADNLACAVDVHENLSLERLGESYGKIARVKTLAKATIPTVSQGIPVADATMGIIFARDSDAPIEALAEELARLNGKHSYRVWPDMILVLSRGTVNLACQIPYKPLGDFLPPGRGVAHRAAMYIHVSQGRTLHLRLTRCARSFFHTSTYFSPGWDFRRIKEFLRTCQRPGCPLRLSNST
jgi:hypothetical protein